MEHLRAVLDSILLSLVSDKVSFWWSHLPIDPRVPPPIYSQGRRKVCKSWGAHINPRSFETTVLASLHGKIWWGSSAIPVCNVLQQVFLHVSIKSFPHICDLYSMYVSVRIYIQWNTVKSTIKALQQHKSKSTLLFILAKLIFRKRNIYLNIVIDHKKEHLH